MPAYKDEERGTWYCKFAYTDWTGQRRQKLKRGFSKKSDAKNWERDFLERQQGTPEMTFQSLYDLYLEDITKRLRTTTVATKTILFQHYILPAFRSKQINEIKPADIRKWQNEVIQSGAKATYQRTIYNQLNCILNFAVKYYGLPHNPCSITGPIGKTTTDKMDFWTLDEFNQFIKEVTNPESRLAYQILFFSGIRLGEMLALNPNTDIDLQNNLLRITKTYTRLHKQDIVTAPKTEHSIRTVTIPAFLVEHIREYMTRIYHIEQAERLFVNLSKWKLAYAMKRGCALSGVKRIRLHDLRHSHVSLLINMGSPPLLIAERIGDSVEMINKIYGHLYPNRHTEVADQLQKLVSK